MGAGDAGTVRPKALFLNAAAYGNIPEGLLACIDARRYRACFLMYMFEEKISHSQKKCLLCTYSHCSMAPRRVERLSELQMHVTEDL